MRKGDLNTLPGRTLFHYDYAGTEELANMGHSIQTNTVQRNIMQTCFLNSSGNQTFTKIPNIRTIV